MSTAPGPSPLRLLASISRLHIVAIAALGTLTFGWLWLGSYPWELAGITALDWMLVNLLNRVVDLPEDRANRITGTDFVADHRRAILVVGFGTLAASLVLVHLAWPGLLPLRLGYHALGLTYNWPLLPGGRRIKALYFWKNTASAVGFLLTVFGYPLAAAGWSAANLAPGITATTIAVAAGFFFCFELSYEVIYDLRDRPGDAAAGVRTYPVVHGERGAVRIIDGLIATSIVTLVAGYAAGVVPWRLVVMVLAPALQLVLYKRALARGITSADCVRLTWLGAGLLAAYHGWVALGLPGVGA
ncbi:MAG: UbiA family prenyltransferase [Kofleriaceae bacterium]